MTNDRKLIVISAVNLTEGGTLSIFKDCLQYVSDHIASQFDVLVLAHDRRLCDVPNVRYREFPLSKKSWLRRLFYEWVYFPKLSKELKPFLWLSLHDITPRVYAARQAVYCHNPSPFYQLKFSEIFLDWKFFLFNQFYALLYSVHIKRNDWVIVQQEWLREQFKKRYSIDNVVVAHPNLAAKNDVLSLVSNQSAKTIFFFPTFPRLFKNIEVIGNAVRILRKQACSDFEVVITINGDENRYAKSMVERFSDERALRFIGLQSREQVFDLYAQATCLIFPSKLETWGMPLSESKQFTKPILVADLPYAHETVGCYDQVKYFDPEQPAVLAEHMKALIEGRLVFDTVQEPVPAQPFAENWDALFKIMLGDAVVGSGGNGQS